MLNIKNMIRVPDLINKSVQLLGCRANITQWNACLTSKKGPSIEEKIGMPERPKKPLTPYFRFMNMNRAEVVAKNPNVLVGDIIKLLAKKWEAVDTKTKQKLQEDFKKDQILYVEKRAAYDSKITPEQKEVLKLAKLDIREAKAKRAYRKRVRELGRPKRPASAFMKFLADAKTKYPQESGLAYKDWHSKMTEKWGMLTDSEKTRFLLETRKEYEGYKVELQKWEDEMLKLGNTDVVRNEALIEVPSAKPRRKKSITDYTPEKDQEAGINRAEVATPDRDTGEKLVINIISATSNSYSNSNQENFISKKEENSFTEEKGRQKLGGIEAGDEEKKASMSADKQEIEIKEKQINHIPETTKIIVPETNPPIHSEEKQINSLPETPKVTVPESSQSIHSESEKYATINNMFKELPSVNQESTLPAQEKPKNIFNKLKSMFKFTK